MALPGMALPGLANLARVFPSDNDNKTSEESSDVGPEPTGPLKPLSSQFSKPSNRGRRLPTRIRKSSASVSGKSEQPTTANEEEQESTPELIVEPSDESVNIVTEEPDEIAIQDTNISDAVTPDAAIESYVNTKESDENKATTRSTSKSSLSHQRTASASSSTSSTVSKGHRSSRSATLKKSDILTVTSTSSSSVEKSPSQSSISSSSAGKKRTATLDPSSRLYAPTASSAAKQRAPVTKSNSVNSRHDGRLSPLSSHGTSGRRSLSRSPSRLSMRNDDGYDSNDS
jgi:hypothetical protein